MGQIKMEDPRVQQLANTLKSHGLAASMYEAIEKAKSILNVETPKSDNLEEQNEAALSGDDYDITREDATLNELMKELGVTPEQIEAQKQEKLNGIETEVHQIKEEIKQAEKNPEKIEQAMEEISKVKDEIDSMQEINTGEKPQESKEQPEKDMFEEEKKIDLTRVFNYKK